MKRSPLLAIFLTIFIDLIGFGIMIPVLPIYAESLNATGRAISLLFAVYSLMQFIFAPIWGSLSDRYGRRPILLFSVLGGACGFLILGFAHTLALLFAGRILSGITGGNISTAQAYIADSTTRENRAKGMGLIGAAFGLGFIVGPAIGGLLYKYGAGVPFFFAAGLAFVNAALIYLFLPETVTPAAAARAHERKLQFSRWQTLQGAFQNQSFAIVTTIYFLFIIAFSIMTTAYVLYTKYRFGYTPVENGKLFAFIGLIGAIVQGGLIGRLVKRFGEVPLVIIGSALMVVTLFAVPFVSPQTGALAGLLIGSAAISVAGGLVQPSLTSLASKSADDDNQGSALGIAQSAASLARAVGPALVSVLIYSATAANILHIDDAAIQRTFWTASGITLLGLILTLLFVSHLTAAATHAPAPPYVYGEEAGSELTT